MEEEVVCYDGSDREVNPAVGKQQMQLAAFTAMNA